MQEQNLRQLTRVKILVIKGIVQTLARKDVQQDARPQNCLLPPKYNDARQFRHEDLLGTSPAFFGRLPDLPKPVCSQRHNSLSSIPSLINDTVLRLQY